MNDNERQQARNRLVVCVCAAACAGFILAMYLGAFFAANATTEMKEVPAWASTLIAGVSALVSAYAVYLVAATLKATRDTLDATRTMAEDQRIMAKDQARIGDAQTRAWVFYESCDVQVLSSGFLKIIPTLKNFGTTPALGLEISVTLIRTIPETLFLVDDITKVELRHLPPGTTVNVSTGPLEVADRAFAMAVISWSYGTVSGEVSEENIILVVKTYADGDHPKPLASPLNIIDYELFDEIYECDSENFIVKNLIEKGILTEEEYINL